MLVKPACPHLMSFWRGVRGFPLFVLISSFLKKPCSHPCKLQNTLISPTVCINIYESAMFAKKNIEIHHESGVWVESPSRGSPIIITRLAEWWQTVIARVVFSIPSSHKLWILFLAHQSPLNTLFYIGKREKCFQKIPNMLRYDIHVVWWCHFNIIMM